ncbi:MAG: putative porin [Candidatus Acidiferrales bacterium]
MRRTWIGMVVLGLLVVASARGDEDTAARPAAATVAAKKAAKSSEAGVAKKTEAEKNEKAPPREPSAVEAELEQLRVLILEQSKELVAQRAAMREQQQRMETLAEELREVRAGKDASAGTAANPGGSPTSGETVAASQDDLGNRVNKVERDLADTKKAVEGRIKGFGPFTFSGDVRLRYENAFGGRPISGAAGEAQHRERYRIRLNANAKFNDEFSGGFSLASGDLNNPVSTNQTINQFYIRRTIGIDRAFVAYNPAWLKPLTVTAGKFPYTWYRTELAWDNDLNPEGVSEALHWNWKDSFFQHLGIVALQMPFNSTFTGGGAAKSSVVPAAAMFGGQLQTNLRLHERVKFGAYAAYYYYRNPDQLAQGQATGVIGGNGQTNFVGTVGSGTSATTLFASKWGILDAIARLDVNTGIGRFPLMLLFDFAQNTKACENLPAFTGPAPAPFCDSRQRHAYWGELQLGKTQEKGDVRFGYTFMRIERDAVLSAWTFDDKRQATNVAQHRMEIFYQAYRQITLGFTGFFGRQLLSPNSRTTSVALEHYLKRFQFDVIYKF